MGDTKTTPQRTITITELVVKNTLTNGSITEVTGPDMNFSCFDINPSNLAFLPGLKM